MRTALLVAAAVASSVISLAAQQPTPPVATPPATSPPATTPSPVSAPSTKPPVASVPTTRPPAARAPRTSAPTLTPPTTSVQGVPTPQTPPSRTTTPEAPRPGQKAPAAPGWTPGTPGASWQNVRLDIKISDTANPDGGKTVTIVCMDGQNGQVRSQSGDGLINIDAKPTVRGDGRIWVQLTIEYQADLTPQQTQLSGSSRGVVGFGESLSLVVADGKPMVASQSADPKSDRKVVVEVTATVQPIK
jgi:hypothetical protein